jgi:hypothetical protein
MTPKQAPGGDGGGPEEEEERGLRQQGFYRGVTTLDNPATAVVVQQ